MATLDDLKTSAVLLSSKTISHNMPFKKQVLQYYSGYIANAILSILDQTSVSLDDIEAFLKNNWEWVKHTLLGYTAIPHEPITRLLCNLAEYCAEQRQILASHVIPIPAIVYLMPGVAIKPACDPHYVLLHTPPMDGDALFNLTQGKDGIVMDNARVFYEFDASTRDLFRLSLTPEQTTQLNNYFEDMSEGEQKAVTPTELQFIHRFKERKPTELYPNLSTIPLLEVVSTHIINEKGNALLPVRLLTIDEVSCLMNPYFDACSYSHEALYLSDSEKKRLTEHSILTKAIHVAAKQYETIISDKQNLLGQLWQLCDILQSNSARYAGGSGEDVNAGMGAYGAIIVFNEYYQRLDDGKKTCIPLLLRNEIELLINLASDKSLNSDASGQPQIPTCIAKRRSALVAKMQGQEAVLSEIAIMEDSRAELLIQSRTELNRCQRELIQALSNPATYSGADSLELNCFLLEGLHFPFVIHSFIDLETFYTFSPTEISHFMQNNQILEQFIGQIRTIDHLVEFFYELSPLRLQAVLDASAPAILSLMNNNVNKLVNLLQAFNEERFDILFSIFKTALFSLLKIEANITLLSSSFSVEQMAVLCKDAYFHEWLISYCYKSKDPDAILIKMLKLLPKTQEQLMIVCSAIKNSWLNKLDFYDLFTRTSVSISCLTAICNCLEEKICLERVNRLAALRFPAHKDRRLLVETIYLLASRIDNIPLFYDIFKYLTFEERRPLYEAIKNRLLAYIRNADEVVNLLEFLTQEERNEVYEKIGHHLSSFIVDADDFNTILAFISRTCREKRSTLFAGLQDQLASFIEDSYDFISIMQYLSIEERHVIYNQVKDKIPSFIYDVHDVVRIWCYLTPEECSAIYASIKNKLPALIHRAYDFCSLFNYLCAEERTEIYMEVKDRLPSLIHRVQDFSDIVRVLGEDESTSLYLMMEAQLESFVRNAGDVSMVLEYISIEQRTGFFMKIKDRLPSLINGAEEFNSVLKHLNQSECGTVYLMVKERLPSFINSAEAFNMVLKHLNQDECGAVYLMVKERLPSFINSAEAFNMVLEHLNQDECKAAYLMVEARLESFIVDACDVYLILEYISIEQRTLFFSKIKDQLPFLIDDVEDFNCIVKYLNQEECGAVYAMVEARLESFIKNANDVSKALEYMPMEQRATFTLKIKDRLPSFIHNNDDFFTVLEYLSKEGCATLYPYVRGKLTTLIEDWVDFIDFLDYFPIELSIDAYHMVKKRMPNLMNEIGTYFSSCDNIDYFTAFKPILAHTSLSDKVAFLSSLVHDLLGISRVSILLDVDCPVFKLYKNLLRLREYDPVDTLLITYVEALVSNMLKVTTLEEINHLQQDVSELWFTVLLTPHVQCLRAEIKELKGGIMVSEIIHNKKAQHLEQALYACPLKERIMLLERSSIQAILGIERCEALKREMEKEEWDAPLALKKQKLG